VGEGAGHKVRGREVSAIVIKDEYLSEI